MPEPRTHVSLLAAFARGFPPGNGSERVPFARGVCPSKRFNPLPLANSAQSLLRSAGQAVVQPFACASEQLGPRSGQRGHCWSHERRAARSATRVQGRTAASGLAGAAAEAGPLRLRRRPSGTRFGNGLSLRLRRRATSPGMRAYRLRNGDCGKRSASQCRDAPWEWARTSLASESGSSSAASAATSGESGRRF